MHLSSTTVPGLLEPAPSAQNMDMSHHPMPTGCFNLCLLRPLFIKTEVIVIIIIIINEYIILYIYIDCPKSWGYPKSSSQTILVLKQPWWRLGIPQAEPPIVVLAEGPGAMPWMPCPGGFMALGWRLGRLAVVICCSSQLFSNVLNSFVIMECSFGKYGQYDGLFSVLFHIFFHLFPSICLTSGSDELQTKLD